MKENKLSHKNLSTYNNGKRFSVILMNPPYGNRGSTLNLDFVNKCLDISDKQITIMPLSIVEKSVKQFTKYKEKFSKYLIKVDEVNGQEFEGTAQLNVGIYIFDNNKKENDKIQINVKTVKTKEVDSLLNVSRISNYENEIFEYLLKQGQIEGTWAGGHDHCTKNSLNKKGIYDDNKIKELINQNIIDNCKALKNNKVYLMTCLVGGGKPLFICGKRIGKIYTSKDEVIKDLLQYQTTSGYNFLFFDSVKAAENCKIALQNPLLRLTLYVTQDGQILGLKKCYKYVPDINWEDARVKTDEGLLEICGCPKDKCKEYADYCKKTIEDIDYKYNHLEDRRGFNARI